MVNTTLATYEIGTAVTRGSSTLAASLKALAVLGGCVKWLCHE